MGVSVNFKNGKSWTFCSDSILCKKRFKAMKIYTKMVNVLTEYVGCTSLEWHVKTASTSEIIEVKIKWPYSPKICELVCNIRSILERIKRILCDAHLHYGWDLGLLQWSGYETDSLASKQVHFRKSSLMMRAWVLGWHKRKEITQIIAVTFETSWKTIEEVITAVQGYFADH